MLPIQGSGQGEQVKKGVYIGDVVIAGVEDISGQQLEFMSAPCDIGLKLILDIGKTFQPEMTIMGNFNREDGTVKGWGRAFVVRDFMNRLGIRDWLTEDNRFRDGVLTELVNKSFLRLSYVSGRRKNGKVRYSDWSQVGTKEEGASKLLERFEASLAKGYPNNYSPDTLDEPAPDTATFP